MKLPGDDGKRSMGPSVVYMVISVSVFVLVVLLVVMKSNRNQVGSEYVKNALEQQKEQVEAVEKEEAGPEPEQKRRAEDLDFWDMYPVDEEGNKAGEASNGQAGASGEETEPDKDKEKEETVQEDPATDGRHTLIKYTDGTEEWVLISPYLPKNTYDFSNLSGNGSQLKYTENGKKISRLGVNLSKHSGKVNFGSLKSSGVDYVMIRLGARGYTTGQISLDENFVENMEGAIEAGLDIGVYFYSQAINEEEANQEANFVIQNLEPYKTHISYPIAFDMENISNDAARIDGLSRDDKTMIARTFLNGVEASGYVPMVYGNKEWLIKNVDLAKLQEYDIWLSQDMEKPDYPYQFAMWQYASTGSMSSVSGDAYFNLCFVSYSDR